MQAAVSIITVCLNAREHLLATQASIVSQSCQDFEWIIVDGGSSDGTVELLDTFSEDRVRVLSEPDQGIYDAMNKGLRMAQGQWVWFLNAGDLLFDHTVLEQVAGLCDSIEVCYGDVQIDGDGHVALGLRSKVSPHQLPDDLKSEEFRYGMVVSHQAFVVKRLIVPDYAANLYQYSADLDWMLGILSQSRRSVKLGTLACVLREGATMRHWKQSQWERFLILSHHFGFMITIANHGLIVWRRLWHGARTRFWR